MTPYAASERTQLSDLFEQLGPDAPTLDEGWVTRDLAAHLVLRERRPDAGVGIVAKPLAGYTAQVQRQFAARPWPELVKLVRTGPPRWSPYALPALDRRVNLVEYFVHHEDVRRAQPAWAPRELDPGLQEALWQALQGMARVLYRKVPVGVLLRRETGVDAVVKVGSPAVVVTGEPQELLLHGLGRRGAAAVAIDGPPEAVRRLAESPLGL